LKTKSQGRHFSLAKAENVLKTNLVTKICKVLEGADKQVKRTDNKSSRARVDFDGRNRSSQKDVKMQIDPAMCVKTKGLVT
jgi:hypothetical protein